MDEAEAHRVFGELLRRQPAPDIDAAEASFAKALQVSRCQEAKGFELRAAMSLASLWLEQGKRKQARQLLADVYGWFKEGFDTQDLKAARELLARIA